MKTIIITSIITPIIKALLTNMIQLAKNLYSKLFLTPFNEFRAIREDICTALKKYKKCYHNPVREDDMCNQTLPSKHLEASEAFEDLSVRLSVFSNKHRFFAFFLIPKKEKLEIVSRDLRGLANSMSWNGDDDTIIENRKMEKEILQILHPDKKHHFGK